MTGQLKRNLSEITAIIAKARSDNQCLSDLKILAVSKKQSSAKIRELFDLGVKDFGENYLQEFQQKKLELSDLDINWHYIGAIQSKKLKDLVGHFDLIHSISRLSEVEKIAAICNQKGLTQKYLIQVNIAKEPSKQGVNPEDLATLVEKVVIFQQAQLCGLMIFPPLEKNPEASLKWFRKSRELFDKINTDFGLQLDCLSMGTSSDFDLAYSAGSTCVRIGERLMGSRSE